MKQNNRISILIMLTIAASTGALITCTAARQDIATGTVAVLDCEAAHLDAKMLADAKTFAIATVQHWLSGDAAPNSEAIRADLAPIASDLGKCAVAAVLVAATAASVPPTPGTAIATLAPSGPDPAQVRAAFSSAIHQLGWTVKVAGATL